jgi:acyl-CoA synthetase (NDP forming)
MRGLDALMAPESVAIIGASDDPSRIGGRTVAMVRDMGFRGPIYPVNKTRKLVQGLAAYPTVGEIPGPVDCAIISIPAEHVVQAIRDCAAKGVGSAVVFSAGFAEMREEGRLLQEEITRIARDSGMRVLGPNCTGMYNLDTGAYLSFYDARIKAMVPGRNIGVVTQSGGYGAHIIQLARHRGLSVGHWVTTGNECDVEIGEVLEAFAADPAVDVLVGYIEGIRDRDSFLRALALARRNRKPVILMKSGRTPQGAVAAASHTASLAGFDAAYDAVFREYGVHRARSTEEVLDVAYAATGGKLPPDRRVAIMTNSGGMGVQIADFAADAGLELPTVPPAAQEKILALVPNGSPHNPVDFTAQWLNQPELIPGTMDVLLGDCGFPALICFMGGAGGHPQVMESVGGLMRRYPDRLVIMCSSVDRSVAAAYEDMGCLVFEEPSRAMTALAALAGFGAAFATPASAAPKAAGAPRLPGGLRLNEREAKALLAGCGVPCPREVVVSRPELAAAAAAEIGFPVGLKILSPDIPHKTDVGGVALGLNDAEAVTEAALRMHFQVADAKPEARLDGFIVTPMLTGGVECIIGVNRDPIFGPMVMVGMGGVGVELLKDVTWRLAPVTEAEATGMVGALKLSPLLTGYRGRPRMDVPALAAAIAAISRLAAANAGHIRTIEVNPILVLPEGEGAVALDAVIETDELIAESRAA